MAVKGAKETPRTFPVVRCNTMPRRANGFTLLELLVVLSVLAVMVSLVAPNLNGLIAQDKAKNEAYALRDVLQTVIDQSWLDGRSSFIELQQDELVLWQRQDGQWRSKGSVHVQQSSLESQLIVANEVLSKAQQSLGVSGHMAWVALASGEYLPFRWRIQGANKSYTVIGDGINGLRIEE